MILYAQKNTPVEWSLSSAWTYDDPFNDVALDVLFTAPDGSELRMPAFWDGGLTWRVRFAPTQEGTYTFRTECSDADNPGLHGQQGTLVATPYTGQNPLLAHGFLRLAANRRHLEHADGAPFFWLGDTWWMGFTPRLRWPDAFQMLTIDRVQKGFTLIQIVAGLYPDMEWYDPRGANEAGFPWDKHFKQLNPAYFDQADVKVAHLVRSGLAPCIVGSWGYFMEFAGLELLKRHWRNLVARYAAYPVVWCVAGEAMMDYYLAERPVDPAAHQAQLRAQWTELARYIRSLDPYHHPVTIHPTQFGHEQVSDPSVLDVDMLQTGHDGIPTLSNNINSVEKALAFSPALAVVVAETNYEGILGTCYADMQRFLVWSSLLSGAAFTYGANGIWQFNGREQPYGPSPHGVKWGDTPWEEAYRLSGSTHAGLAAQLLKQLPWERFEAHPEWIEPHQTEGNRLSGYAAGVPGEVRVIYFPPPLMWAIWGGNLTLEKLEPGVTYTGMFYNPCSGEKFPLGEVCGDAAGRYVIPKPPIFQDWVIVLTRA